MNAARAAINRQNAQSSTGPRTAEGKERSRFNSLGHGLTAKHVVIPGEDPAEYEAHRADLIKALNPANSVEAELAEELAASSWRLKRAHRVETAVLSEIAANSPDPCLAIAKSFLERPKELDRLTRYITSIERAYWRVFNKLEAIQKARREQEGQEEIEQSYLKSLKERKTPQSQTAGFVSKSAEIPAVTPAPELIRTAAAGQSLSNSPGV
jgi:hypothetical protein